MTRFLKPKFAYFIYKLPDTTMVFIDYTCKGTMTHMVLENPMGLIVFHMGKKKPTIIIDYYYAFSERILIKEITEIVIDLTVNKFKLGLHFTMIPCPELTAFLSNSVAEESKCIFGPDFNARIYDAIKGIKFSAANLEEQKLADSLVEHFKNISG